MAVTQYIGSRYVPLFADPIEWSASNTYEPLTIVIHEGNSYTSKQAVPKDIDISNEAFWALTGNYNAQVELYRRETALAKATADDAQADADAAQADIDTLLPKADFSAVNTVRKYVDDSVAEVQADIDTLLPKADFSSENTVKSYIDEQDNILKNYFEKYTIKQCVDYYGADPTGATDSSAAIAECIAANKGKSIYFTSGTYLISTPIVTPFAHADRVSIDFNGATITSNATLSCLLYIGGDIQGVLPHDTPSKQVRTFFKNGKFNAANTSTAIILHSGVRDDDASKYVSYTNAVIEGCNIIGFAYGIQVGEFAGQSASDLLISNCLIRRDFASGTRGIDAKSTDIDIRDTRIYGYQFSIYSDHSSGIVVDGVHSLDNGASTAQEIESMAFLYSEESGGGYVLTNCYCDATGTFVKFHTTARQPRYVLSMTNCIFYTPGGIVHDMCVVDMSEIANSNYNVGEIELAITGNQFYFMTKRTNDIGIKLPANANMHLFMINGIMKLKNNTIVRAENLAAGDLLLNSDCFTSYIGNVTFDNNWLPIARIPVALNVNAGAMVRLQVPVTNCDTYELYITYTASLAGELTRCNMKVLKYNTQASTLTFGVSLERAACGAYELVVYIQNSVQITSTITVTAPSNPSNLLISPISMLVFNALGNTNLVETAPAYTIGS